MMQHWHIHGVTSQTHTKPHYSHALCLESELTVPVRTTLCVGKDGLDEVVLTGLNAKQKDKTKMAEKEERTSSSTPSPRLNLGSSWGENRSW